MNVLDFRTQLATALSGYLGTYTFPNGSTTPALSVRGTGDLLLPGTKIEGLEAVLDAEPVLTPIKSYSNEKALSAWRVVLTDWENAGQLQTIAAQLLATFPGSQIKTPQKDAPGIGFRSQLELEIPDNSTQAGVTPLPVQDVANAALRGPTPTYDNAGRVTRIDYEGGYAKTFAYDLLGQLVAINMIRPYQATLRKTLTWANGQWQGTSAPEVI